MRLTIVQIESIKKAFIENFDQSDHLWLFGSRVDDHKRGGDIDLYIEVNCNDVIKLVDKKIKFLTQLEIALGEQKIDIVINVLSLKKEATIYTEARNTGIKLI